MGPQHEVVAGAPPKALQIPTQISGGYSALDRLAETIDQLEQRLCNALREDSNTDKEKAEQGELVPIASDIRGIWNRINGQADRIDNICSRLEL